MRRWPIEELDPRHFPETTDFLLSYDPPAIRVLTYLLASLLVAAVGWSFVAPYDETIAASTAQVSGRQSVHHVTAMTAGRLESVRAKEGARVGASDVLAVLAVPERAVEVRRIAAEIAAISRQLELLEQRVGQVEVESRSELRVARLAVAAAQATEIAMAAEEEVAGARLRTAETEAERLGQLGYLASDAERVQAGQEVQALRAGREAATARVRQARVAHEQARERLAGMEAATAGTLAQAALSDLELEREERRRELAAAKAEHQRLALSMERTIVRAPVAGRVTSVIDASAGGLVAEGTEIARIVAGEDVSVIEATTSDRGAGGLREAATARVTLPAYPYQDFGVLTGRVQRVGEEVRDTWRFEVRLDPSRDPRITLRPGMAAEVEVTVERTTIAGFVVKKLRLR
ncbi:MAG: HlyD family efflux transporter periplasmic adaptor subunit [Candidatus Schekmanbacteria bacterium]|nr:HlyD family efflux transporter periplasmic adaptor subunit [Candidatus Schekmanbacteria bacterium]